MLAERFGIGGAEMLWPDAIEGRRAEGRGLNFEEGIVWHA